MPVTLYQSDGVLVPPVADARLYEMLSGGAVGIVQGCEITSLGGNKLQITSGWGVCKGRAFYIEQETINAKTSPGGEVSGRLILNIDMSNSGIPAAFVTQAQSPLPELVQEDINLDGNIYQMPLSVYNIGELSISDLRTVYPKANVSGIGLYIHSKSGMVHEFTGQGANGRALMTADVSAGDTFTVNGEPVNAYMGTDNATESMAGSPYTGKWVTFVVEDGVLNFKGGGKVTVDGLSADVVKTGATVTVKQGAKVVQSVQGSFDGMRVQTQRFSFTIGSNSNSSTTVNTPEGSTVIGMQKTEAGNRPPATRVEISSISGNTATISYSNPFGYSYNAAGYLLYTFD